MVKKSTLENQPAPDEKRPTLFSQIIDEFLGRVFHPITIVTCLSVSILMTIVGPYGTYENDPLLFRIIFWSGVVWSSTFLATFTGTWMLMRFANRPYWQRALCATILFSSIYTPILMLVLSQIYDEVTAQAWEVFLICVAVCAIVYTLIWFFEQLEAKNDANALRDVTSAIEPQQTLTAQPVPTQPKSGDFLKRLGPDAGKRLIRLSMANHYIEAHTENGMHLLYMRFADALAELSDYHGCQVHRSHWVNFNEVADVVKDGQKLSFKMSDDSIVPISRSRRKDLRDRQVI